MSSPALSTASGLVERAAHRIARQPGHACQNMAHRLELLARRPHHIQQDHCTTTTHLHDAAHPPMASAPLPSTAPSTTTASSPLADRFLTIRHDRDPEEVLARGGAPEAHSGIAPLPAVPGRARIAV
ncbi:hypothetical protein [Streptomyces sp. YGL11-2]|uniref:hypothetical protein n=1 Tax=Streptomyces sp. YGL11-2 TaxID=3414028 RepID=UPI003CF551AA